MWKINLCFYDNVVSAACQRIPCRFVLCEMNISDNKMLELWKHTIGKYACFIGTYILIAVESMP
jgi:hypothetical protein